MGSDIRLEAPAKISSLAPLAQTELGASLALAASQAQSQRARSLVHSQADDACAAGAAPASEQQWCSAELGTACTVGMESQAFQAVAAMVESTLAGCEDACLQHRVLCEEVQCAAAEQGLQLMANPEVPLASACRVMCCYLLCVISCSAFQAM